METTIIRKQCFGTCVDNPFGTLENLVNITDTAREITRQTFLKHCDIQEDKQLMSDMRSYPSSFEYYKNKDIYFFVNSCIEYFYK